MHNEGKQRKGIDENYYLFFLQRIDEIIFLFFKYMKISKIKKIYRRMDYKFQLTQEGKKNLVIEQFTYFGKHAS